MRVLLTIHLAGGTGSVISTLHLCTGLVGQDVDVALACPVNSEVESLARDAGLPVFPVRFQRSRRANATTFADLLARERFDLVNSQSARDRAALTWLGLTRTLGLPVVFTRRQMPRTFWLENWLASRVATRVIAVSPPVGEALARRGTPRRKLIVIPNGVVLARIDRLVTVEEVDHWRTRIGWDAGQRTVAIVARPKAQTVVLRALDQVTTPVRLVLAGVGEAFTEERSRVPARHSVVCLPFLPDLRGLYELLDLVMLPTRDEGLSQALLEAMALGKPVIASAVPGNAFVIRDAVNGLLRPLNDPPSWAQAIDSLLADGATARRLGSAARVTAREEFSLEQTVQRTAGVYREILEGLPGSRLVVPIR